MSDPREELARLDSLYLAGQLTEADYAAARGRIIGTAGPQAGPPPPPMYAPGPVFTPAPYAPVQLRSYRRRTGRGPASVIVTGVGLVVAAAVIAVAVHASDSSRSSSAPQVEVSIPSFSAPSLTLTSAPTARPAVPVGASVTVKDDGGHDVRLTLLSVAATTHATDQFDDPTPGHRYFAARLEITVSAGADAYSDSPENGAEAVDSAHRQFAAAITVGKIAAGPLFPITTSIAAGHSAIGWIVFEVPTAAKITGVRFALDSGFGDGGSWIVP